MDEKIEQRITSLAKKCRIDILKMTTSKKAGFIGSDYSCIDILAVIYDSFFEDSKDKLILSKGHSAGAWYAVLANTGRISAAKLEEFNTSGENMGVHPKRGSLPQIETSTGSLGQGVGLACGMALGEKIANRNGRVFTIMGDGEANEGSVWEVIMFAARRGLDNLFLFLDRNHLQSYGWDEEVLNISDFGKKFTDFGWDTQVIDGHDYNQIGTAIENALKTKGKPHAIIAETIKGKGVQEFENSVLWHYKFPTDEIMKAALRELSI